METKTQKDLATAPKSHFHWVVQLKFKPKALIPMHHAVYRFSQGNTWDTDLLKEAFHFSPLCRWLSCLGTWDFSSQTPSSSASSMQSFTPFPWETSLCLTRRGSTPYIFVPKVSLMSFNNSQSYRKTESDVHQSSGFGRGDSSLID